MRQVVLDTETTGLDPHKGHRIIEIGCVELIDRKRTGNELHQYLQPDRKIDAGAIEVHGITNEFLKPDYLDAPLLEVPSIVVKYFPVATGVDHHGFLPNRVIYIWISMT